MDTFDDLNDLIDSDLDKNFALAAKHLQKIHSKLDSNTLLRFYAHYKQATEGSCANSAKPKWYDAKAKTKWQAWANLGDMSRTQAKLMYIEMLEKLDGHFKRCRDGISDDKVVEKEGWVCVSTHVKTDEIALDETTATVIDYFKEDDLDKVKQLLSNCSTHDLNLFDSDGLALIHWIADRGNIDILKLVLDKGADINLQDSDGQTALHYAVSCGHFECVSKLLESGSDVSAKDGNGLTPLNLANDDNIRDLLLEKLISDDD